MGWRTQMESRAKKISRDSPAGAPKAAHVKEVLLTLRDRLAAQLENGEDHDPGMVHALWGSMREELNQINRALVRIEEGKYGICANCRTVIAADRLVARPYSTLCLDCQERQERGRLERH